MPTILLLCVINEEFLVSFALRFDIVLIEAVIPILNVCSFFVQKFVLRKIRGTGLCTVMYCNVLFSVIRNYLHCISHSDELLTECILLHRYFWCILGSESGSAVEIVWQTCDLLLRLIGTNPSCHCTCMFVETKLHYLARKQLIISISMVYNIPLSVAGCTHQPQP